MPGDIGRFVGRYLQVLAALTVLGMVISLFGGTVSIDVTFILLFWAGAALVRHSALARRLVILASTLVIGAALGMLLIAGRIPLDDVGVRVLGIPVAEPSVGLVALFGCMLLLTAAVPLVLLLTPQARREFRAA